MDWARAPRFGHGAPSQARRLRPSAYGLVADERRRIAVVRAPDGVFLPGGGIEPGETPQVALEREALEECGWTIRVGEPLAEAVQLTPTLEKPSSFFAIEVLHSTGAGSEPGHQTLWLIPAEAASLLLYESHAWAVHRFVQAVAPDHMASALRRIAGFHQDDRGDWVADLECGHGQHVRHDPPWQLRPWVLTAEGRARQLGVVLHCVDCAKQG